MRQAGFRHVHTRRVHGTRRLAVFQGGETGAGRKTWHASTGCFDYRRESAAFVRSDPLQAALEVLEWRWLVEGGAN